MRGTIATRLLLTYLLLFLILQSSISSAQDLPDSSKITYYEAYGDVESLITHFVIEQTGEKIYIKESLNFLYSFWKRDFSKDLQITGEIQKEKYISSWNEIQLILPIMQGKYFTKCEGTGEGGGKIDIEWEQNDDTLKSAISWECFRKNKEEFTRLENIIFELYRYSPVGGLRYVNELMKQQKYEMAIEELKQIMDDYPSTDFELEALYELAGIYRTLAYLHRGQKSYMNDIMDELNAYTEATIKFPTQKKVSLFQIAQLYRDLGMIPEAIATFKLFINEFPNVVDPNDFFIYNAITAYQICIFALNQAGDYPTAIIMANHGIKALNTIKIWAIKALQKGHTYDDVNFYVDMAQFYIKIADSYKNVGFYEKSVEAYFISLAYFQECQKVPYCIGYSSSSENLKENLETKLLEIFKKKLADENNELDLFELVVNEFPDPESAIETLYALGNLHESVGAWNEAIKAYENLFQIKVRLVEAKKSRYGQGWTRREEDALYKIACIYDEKLKDTQKAQDAYQRLLTRFPDSKWSVSALIYIAKIFESSQNKQEALNAYEKADGLCEKMKATFGNLSECYQAKKNIKRLKEEDN